MLRYSKKGKTIGMNQHAFTLIELLIVIAIIAILSVVVILTLNPASLLQQSRDANRVSDMSVLNSAISIYLSAGGSSLGNSNTVYVSIPDPTATSTAGDQCQGLGLPTLPPNYSYQCAATSTLRNVNGQGWIPINFGTVAIGSSLSQLPIDPTNQSSSRLYYTYTTNGTQFETTAPMESAKYQVGGSNDVISGDGGSLASVYEKGSQLGLEPLDYGDNTLLGYWPLTESTGSVAYDYSGNNATGTWSGTPAGSSGYYSSGKGGAYQWAGYFNGTNDTIVLPTSSLSVYTIAFWYNPVTLQSTNIRLFGTYGTTLTKIQEQSNTPYFYLSGSSVSASNSLTAGQWTDLVGVYDGSKIYLYINGSLVSSATAGSITVTPGVFMIGSQMAGGTYANGLFNDVRVYNRALTAAQVAAMYAGSK